MAEVMLLQRPAEADVQQLEAPADPQYRDVARERALEERELDRIASPRRCSWTPRSALRSARDRCRRRREAEAVEFVGHPVGRVDRDRLGAGATDRAQILLAHQLAAALRMAAQRPPIRGPTASMVFGLVVGSVCSGQADAIDQLNEHTAGDARMKESHESFDAAARRVIDQLDALRGQASERARKVIDDEANVMERGAAALRYEASDTGLRIDRLQELDARTVARSERDADVLSAMRRGSATR